MKPDEKEAENIRVAVRCRPFNERETREQAVSCFTCAPDGTAVLTNVENPGEKHEFGFDFVYGSDSKQEQVFADIGVPLLDRAFGGYNGTIFAYGQTGSGKSFSMTGVAGGGEALEGLTPRMNRAIFERVARERLEHANKHFLVECSYFEIYNEIIYDLLDASGNGKKNKGGLEIKEHSVLGIYVKDLQERVVESCDEVVELMTLGAQARTVGSTQMNAESSRSHSIFTIKIHQKDAEDETKSLFAKINLVDLAGSERAASTGAQGDRLREGANINKSLSALGNVINALVEASRAGKKVFIPYRNSKLTRVLQESLGGNSLCSMLATLSPANINFSETLSTLKYASRAKSIKVNAKKNEASSQISQLNEEIAALKQKLQEQVGATLGLDPKEKDEIVKKYEKQIQEMDRVRLQTWEDKAKLSKQHEMERKKLARERALADERIRDERSKKWRLLEEKGDLELMMRALRDLDGCAPTSTEAKTNSAEGQWLDAAQRMKTMESEAKDLRTLIQVFREALQKDAELWARRSGLQDSISNAKSTKNLLSHRRDDSSTASAAHMTASQMSSKLQNIGEESEKLLALEAQLVSDRGALINSMSRELLCLKQRRAQLKAEQLIATPVTPAGKSAVQAAQEQQQLLEERERGLAITVAMVRSQRAALMLSIKSDRHRVFEFTSVIKQFVSYADQQIGTVQGVNATTSEAQQQLAQWQEAKRKLLVASKAWQETGQSKEPPHNDSNCVEYVALGDVAALGLETRLLPDECLTGSSRLQDAKFARLNAAQSWVPDVQDVAPSLTIDFELPRIFDSVSLRGGQIQSTGTAGVSAESRAATPPSTGGGLAPVPASTFALADPTKLQAARAQYKLDEVTGTNELTYELLGHVMSWQDLLKTDVAPAKLFARPPVRFLHDVLSAVMRNTGFAADAVSPAQRDYAQLASKTDRAEYLTSVLDYVQAWYQRQQQLDAEKGPTVAIAATTSNILAGKEPADTLQFLGFFALAAMEHAALHPPPSAASLPEHQSPEVDNGSIRPELEIGAGGEPSTVPVAPRIGWVTRLRVATSFSGAAGDWRVLGEFDANKDADGIVSIALGAGGEVAGGGSRAGRYLQLTCVAWHERAVLQCEIFGREAQESDTLANNVQVLGAKARALLEQLRFTATLLLEEARAVYERAKLVESEKHAQLASLGEELAKLHVASAAWDKQQREMREQQTQLTAQVEAAVQRGDREQARGDGLKGELAQVVVQAEELRRSNDALKTQLSEHEHQMQTLALQIGEQKRTSEALQLTKQQLEELASNLRGQLANKEQQEDANQQEGKSQIAELSGELMTVRVQLDEQRRALQAAELQRQEQEAFGQQQNAILQQTRASLVAKEVEADARLKARVAESEAALRVLQDDRDDVKLLLERALAAEGSLKASASELETQRSKLEVELESWRRRAEAAEAQAQTVQASSTTTGGHGGQPSEGSGEDTGGERGQDSNALLLEAQANELRRLAELEKMEAKVQSLEQELVESEEKARLAELAVQDSAQRMRELEEAEEELQQQLQVVTDERDSARQKEEQLFTETIEKDQEIERIRDGYGKAHRMLLMFIVSHGLVGVPLIFGLHVLIAGDVVWVTDRMNSKEDELSELQEQLERYQSLLEMTGTKGGGGADAVTSAAAKPKEDKARGELAKLYALAIEQRPIDSLEEPSATSGAPPITNTGGEKSSPVAALAPGPSGEEDADYDDDFDDVDETDEARKARRNQEDHTITLELVERPPESRQDLQDVVAENDRLKHTLNFALASHLMMTEATGALDQSAAFWMKRVEEAVALRLQQAEQQRDALTLQFAGLQERLDDKDQEIERLSHGFVWATESLNAKQDEICELQERLGRYEALLEAQEPI
ncbi:hypothetical protein BBJ28_00003985 [Nothophytophthora sp. Chile5]|nr:hypothetical protein BBJ28_00003985 [Nothophytophthora sp. Chile5]